MTSETDDANTKRADTRTEISTSVPPRDRELISALLDKGVKIPCPMCGMSAGRDLLGEGFMAMMQDGKAVLRGPIIKTVMIACKHCGFVSQFTQHHLAVQRRAQ